tara:strand:+ start:51 stop:782 length:732 start_codon:yes stop_codon:yes gene_type:complete
MEIFDVTKEPYLSEYLKIINDPKYGTGAGINPCKDCKIYIFKKAKEYAEKNKIDLIASGEVLGQRPMSQVAPAKKIIDEVLGFEILRPLSAKLFPPTEAEESGIVDREKLYSIQGRGRKEQMELAEKFGIKYPSPGGGCFLCEKEPSRRLSILIEKNLITEETLQLTMKGRHFFIKDTWFVVGRNALESEMINKFKNSIKDEKGKPAVYLSNLKYEKIAKELQEVYSTGKTEEEREKFKEFKL